jgi:hypothetical protein
MLFGQGEQTRTDKVTLASQQLAEVQQLIDQGQWQAAQDKLQAVTTTVANVNDEQQKQQLVTQWQDLTVKVDAKDPNATLAPGVPPPSMPVPPVVSPGSTTSSTPSGPATSSPETSLSPGTPNPSDTATSPAPVSPPTQSPVTSAPATPQPSTGSASTTTAAPSTSAPQTTIPTPTTTTTTTRAVTTTTTAAAGGDAPAPGGGGAAAGGSPQVAPSTPVAPEPPHQQHNAEIPASQNPVPQIAAPVTTTTFEMAPEMPPPRRQHGN